MRAAGCCGRSGPTTGARRRGRRSTPSRGGRGDRAVRAGDGRRLERPVHRGARRCSTPRCASSRWRTTTAGCATSGRPASSTARGAVRGVDWHFNAWGGSNGGLYFPWDQDDLVARKVLEIERCGRYRAPLVNEGGAIHVDGQGTALVTEECLLNPNRNPQLTRAEIERHLRDYLGVSAGHLARQGRLQRRDRRPHRQSRLLRAPGRGVPDLDRAPARSAVRDLAGCLGAAARCARCARPAPEGDRGCRCPDR